MLNPDIEISAAIIRRCGEDRPADAELRQTFKEHPHLSQKSKKGIVQAVFHYFAWSRFVSARGSLTAQIHEAGLMAEHFKRSPASFKNVDLKANAVPGWIHEVMPVSDAWVRSLQEDPRLWIRARKTVKDEVIRRLPDSRPSAVKGFSETLEYCGTENLFETEPFVSGQIEIQDISSQAVGYLSNPRPGETWWDACAGEGGKSLHLSDLMQGKGLIWATDRSRRRLESFRHRAARAHAFNLRIKEWVELNHRPVKSLCHGVLVDAPCSGVGTWQRNPQARWTLQPKDVTELKQVQLDLLAQGAPQVRVQGKLVYSVCTLTGPETTGVVTEISGLLSSLGFVPLEFQNPFSGAMNSQQTFWPYQSGGNGMFVAMWRRQ